MSCPCFRLSLRPLRAAAHSHPREPATDDTLVTKEKPKSNGNLSEGCGTHHDQNYR
ncbi:hypothetical protein K470DRAFT_160099 [Piedraia hortae CBS 480.64]|uniref:Uncharacterized protein n=1 Tax=Piedraia hortae CBS 480.64 TaxID=1314780 RepID=A0A6A7BR31_9PEZI|nr:hypothetical protein K470DRAFT_160099 [Piedraia hortae CBS 480.64]